MALLVDRQRVDLNNAKCSLVSRAPDWNVVAWNSKDRTIMNVSNADWCHKYHMNKMHWAAELTKPLSVKEDWYMGVPALHCVFPSTEVVGLYMQSNIGKRHYKDNVDDLNRAIVVCLDCVNMVGDQLDETLVLYVENVF